MKTQTELDCPILSTQEWDALSSMRRKGYAVVVFNPEELQGASPKHVQDALVEEGWVVIDALK
jgi:hypothetical protein